MLVDILMIKAVVYPDVLIAAAKRLCVKRIWTDDKKAAVQAGLGSFFYLHRLPGKNAMLQCMQQHPALRNRQWRNIKDYIRNIQLRNSKSASDRLMG